MPQVLIVCCASNISGTETWGLSLPKVSFKGHDTVPPALPPMFVPLCLKERDTGRQAIKIISTALKTVVSSYILVNYALNVLLFNLELSTYTSDTTQQLSLQTMFLQYLFFSFCEGAFLIPYASFLVLGGVPLFFMELSIGQLLQAGPVTAWTKLSRLFSGRNFNEKK